MDYKLEVVVLPVSDVDKAKEFYTGLGWRLDADFTNGDFRVVQVTPPGSPCSVIFGAGLTSATPGSAQGMQLVVTDIDAARVELAGLGADVSEVFHDAGGCSTMLGRPTGSVARPRIIRATARSPRSATRTATTGSCRRSPPGCRAGSAPPGPLSSSRQERPMATTFDSAKELADAMRRASAAHGRHEERIGHPDPNWPDWYADYMVREQAGTELPL